MNAFKLGLLMACLLWIPIDSFAASGWSHMDYQCRRKITISYTAQEPLDDFPVFLKLPKTDLSGADADGDDILVTGSDGVTALPYEIESGDTNYFSLWVKTGISTNAAENELYVYYDNALITQPSERANAVWDANTRLALHCDNSADARDSTANGNDAVITGSCSNLVGSMVGSSLNLFSATDGQALIDNDESFHFNGPITFSAWLRIDELHNANYIIKNKSDSAVGGNYIRIVRQTENDHRIVYGYGNGTSAGRATFYLPTPLIAGNFYHLAITDDSVGSICLYLNGALIENKNIASGRVYQTLAWPWEIAAYQSVGQWTKGVFDELRISSVARSSAWINASYVNQTTSNQLSGGAFFTLGSEERLSGGSPFVDVTEHGIMPGAGDVTAALSTLLNDSLTAGKILYFPAGLYSISATVTNPGNRSLQGPSGRATIQLTASAPVGTVMFSVNGDSCVFKDLVLDGGDLAGQAVHVNSNRKYITINNCEVRNIGGDVVEQALGIKLDGAVRNITISDCSIHDVGGYEDGVTGNGAGAHRGVYIHYGGQNVRIENCTFSEIRGYEDGDAIHVYAYPPVKPGNVVIRGCTFTNIYKRAIKTQYVSGIVIEDCVIESLKTEDLACAKYAMGIMYCEDVSILNNDIFMERAAVVMELPGCSNLNIIGNSIVHDPNRLYASRTWGSWPVTVMLGTYDANPVFNCSVRDNFISGWRHGVHLSAGSMYNDIQYNEIHCPQYPIILYAEEEDNTVANNIIVME